MTAVDDMITEFNGYDFDYFLQSALDRAPIDIDTREGSIMYDLVAPSAVVMAEMTLNMVSVMTNAFVQTATGEWLDLKAEERGENREEATYARALATIVDANGANVAVEIGDRFASIEDETMFYSVSAVNVNGSVELTAETAGTDGNKYIGQLVPVTPNDQIVSAVLTEVTIPARDAESDDDLRARLLTMNETTEFGGNVADYESFVSQIEDVGAVQVYPTWNGGGTVKLVILNNSLTVPSQSLIDEVQAEVDPVDGTGNGYGISPIGHTVTVGKPSLRTIAVSANVDTVNTMTVDDIKDDLTAAIEAYFASVRGQFGTRVDERAYSLAIYRSQITAKLLAVEGVTNVADVELDGNAADVILSSTGQLSELPILGGVTFA